ICGLCLVCAPFHVVKRTYLWREHHSPLQTFVLAANASPWTESRDKILVNEAASWTTSQARGGAVRENVDTMNKALIASVALIALGTSVAGAADLPVKAPPAPVYVPPAFSWTGCYIGGNLGGAWAHSDWHESRFGLDWGNTSDGRFIGGGQIGCNYQFGNPGFVIGVEGDFDWVGNNKRKRRAVLISPGCLS